MTMSLISSVGRNSNKASDLSIFRKMSASSGNTTSHCRIKTMNCNRVTMFQRYLRPNAKKILRMKLLIENVVMVLPITVSIASSSSSLSFEY